jgi:type II secretory pathway pseudopilin PulG
MKKITSKFFFRNCNKKTISNLVSGFTRLVDFGDSTSSRAKSASSKFTTGFTLVETMFAVFILTSTIVGLMTVVSNSLFAARYARDEITVNYLLQEVIDYIRNDRDTTVFLGNGETWDDFFSKYSTPCSLALGGCTIDVLNNTDPETCPYGQGCPYLYYDGYADTSSFYTTDDGINMNGENAKTKTKFRRKIVVVQNATNIDEIDVTVTVDWQNGGLPMTRSLKTSFMKWQ